MKLINNSTIDEHRGLDGFIRYNVPLDVAISEYGLSEAQAQKLKDEYSKEQKRKELNIERDNFLRNMIVTIDKDGQKVTLDADTDSQNNIKMAVLAMEKDEETQWITKDNKPITLKKEDLVKALREIAKQRREIIFKFYEMKNK